MKLKHLPYQIVYLFLCLLPILSSTAGCSPDIPENDIPMEEFQLEDGFSISCLAAEPLLNRPVAFDIDLDNKIWVVEMPAYMRDATGREEDAPLGKIVILEDRDRDGRMDTRKVFLDSLVMARALALVHGGLLYAEPPSLWFVEINGDRPGRRILVDSTYATGLNPEYQANGLLYNLDNWIYSAGSDKRYRFRRGAWETDSTFYRGQWGLSHDLQGRLVYNSNAQQLMGDFVLPGLVELNRNIAVQCASGRSLCENQRVYPRRRTLVNRGYQPQELDSLGRLTHFTAACGPEVYLGDNFPEGFHGNAFVCAPEAHLIKRNILKSNKKGLPQAWQAYQGKEFLASTDSLFRPVFLKTGPEGCLYLADMRHGIIQHQAYMSLYLKLETERQGLDTLSGRGRIYKICYHEPEKRTPPSLVDPTDAQLLELLGHANGWLRLKAQQLLIRRKKEALAVRLEEMVADPNANLKALHALWTLEGMEALRLETIQSALKSGDTMRMAAALKILSESEMAIDGSLMEAMVQLGASHHYGTDLYLAAALSSSLESADDARRLNLLKDLLDRYPADTLFWEMAASGLQGSEQPFIQHLLAERPKASGVRASFSTWLGGQLKERQRNKPNLKGVFTNTDSRTAGLVLYRTYCEACHRHDGSGTNGMAPPLVGSEVVNGPEAALSNVIWNGKSDPVRVKGSWVHYNEPMPAFRVNPAWDSLKLAAVTAYVRNAFAENKAK
jgi:mono/diheme cytochrome c family protein